MLNSERVEAFLLRLGRKQGLLLITSMSLHKYYSKTNSHQPVHYKSRGIKFGKQDATLLFEKRMYVQWKTQVRIENPKEC